MHKKTLNHLFAFLVLLLIILSSCDSYKKDKETLRQAESLIFDEPDRTLQLLDSIYYPQDPGKDFYYHYTLVQLLAKYRCNQDLSQDSIIFQLKEYYVNKNDIENMALSTFLAGCVLQNRKQSNGAMSEYKKAEEYSKNLENNYLKGQIQVNIGDLYYKQYLMNEALERYRNAIKIYEESNDYKRIISVYDKLGNAYQIKNTNDDSAQLYYYMALDLAKKHNDNHEIGFIYRNMGTAYLSSGNLDKSYYYNIEALPYSEKDTEKTLIYTNIATIYQIKGNIDSAIIYVNKAVALDKGKSNPFIQRNVSKVLSRIEEANKNYKKALGHDKDYMQYLYKILDDKNQEKIIEVEKKFSFEQMKNENSRLHIKEQNITITCLVLTLVIIILIIIFFWIQAKDKRALNDAEKKAYQMKLLADSYDKEKSSMRNIILDHFNILKKTALIDAYMRDEEKKQGQKILKKVNETVYGKDCFDWDKTFETLNHLYDNMVNKMKVKYPELDESEFKICCLTYAELNNTEISIIMGFKVNTVQAKKYSVRKKLGIHGYGNLIEFFREDMDLKV